MQIWSSGEPKFPVNKLKYMNFIFNLNHQYFEINDFKSIMPWPVLLASYAHNILLYISYNIYIICLRLAMVNVVSSCSIKYYVLCAMCNKLLYLDQFCAATHS